MKHLVKFNETLKEDMIEDIDDILLPMIDKWNMKRYRGEQLNKESVENAIIYNIKRMGMKFRLSIYVSLNFNNLDELANDFNNSRLKLNKLGYESMYNHFENTEGVSVEKMLIFTELLFYIKIPIT